MGAAWAHEEDSEHGSDIEAFDRQLKKQEPRRYLLHLFEL